MARIRTIKPEFPQSESMGRVSRDARLLFIELWTICDDSGRTRAASRMLASLLFPYDNDAPGLIDGWLEELEREDCIVRYQVDGCTYLQVRKWLSHQKIDKPSPSKIAEFDESSRILANPRERSSEDQGSRIKDHLSPPTAVGADRFAEFWSAYPNKTARKVCLAKWKSRKLDARADAIIADVRRKASEDRRWLDGFVPNPETYLNQDRWDDPIQPKRGGSASDDIPDFMRGAI